MVSYSATAPFLQQNPADQTDQPTYIIIPKCLSSTQTRRTWKPCYDQPCKNKRAPNNGDGVWSNQYGKYTRYPCKCKDCKRHWRNYGKVHFKKYKERSEGYSSLYTARLSCITQLKQGSEHLAKIASKLIGKYPDSYIFATVHKGKSGLDHVHFVISTNHELDREVIKWAFDAHFPGKRIRGFDPKRDYSFKEVPKQDRFKVGIYPILGKKRKPKQARPWRGVAINPIRHYPKKAG